MAGPKLAFIPDILEEHFEELAFLWHQRTSALASPACTTRELAMLEERIAAHLQGLLVAGDALVALLQPALAADDPLVVFAAAYALLHLGSRPAAALVMDAFLASSEIQLDGLRQALCHGPIDLVVDPLRRAVDSAPAPVAVAAAEALAFHRMLELDERRLAELCRHEQAEVRRAGWRIVALLSSTGPG